MDKWVCIKDLNKPDWKWLTPQQQILLGNGSFIEGNIYILHTSLSKGGKYRDIFDIDNNYISTLSIKTFKENFILLNEWRERQINNLLDE